MGTGESNLDRLLKARAEIDEELRRHKSAVTVVFTDLVGSTSYFDRFGDTAGFAMLQDHAEFATNIVTEFQGRVIKTIGDSVMAEFPEPRLAVRAAVELQRRLVTHNQTLPERDRVQVRIGMNSGTGFRKEGDVYGDVVKLAARITKMTGAAQILISRSIREAVTGEDLPCKQVGHVTIRGKADKEEIFEVIWTSDAAYGKMRTELTGAFNRGELIAPGTKPEDLLQHSTAPIPMAGPAAVREVHTHPIPLPPRYTILGEIGRGGMGVVYKAQDNETHEVIALKAIRPEIASDATVMERFKNELRIARQVTHKNVCRIHDFGRSDGGAYISMEFVDGENLRAILKRFGSLPVRKGLEIARQICAGLTEAHAQGIVHRDLKPENVMLDRNGNVKLMDFGIARSANLSALTTGGLIGTPAYMAPEQAEGKLVDHRADIYAVGLVLYELFTGEVAFSGDSPIVVALKQIKEAPRAPREVDPALPTALENTILKCLAKDPGARFQSVAALDQALELGSAAPAAATATPPVVAKPAKAWAIGAIAAAMVIFGIGGGVLWKMRHRAPSPAPAAPVTAPVVAPVAPAASQPAPSSAPSEARPSGSASPAAGETPALHNKPAVRKAPAEKPRPAAHAETAGRVSITGEPNGSSIKVNDALTDYHTPVNFTLPPGTYKITVEHSNYNSDTRTVVVRKNQITKMDVELKPKGKRRFPFFR